jgi:hypothetical protein
VVDDNADSTDYLVAVIDDQPVVLSAKAESPATLTNQAQLTFRQLGSNVHRQLTTIYIDLTAVTNLYGYEFRSTTTKVGDGDRSVGHSSFFDTTTAFVPVVE